MEGLRDDLCSKESLNELVPKVIGMKRMIIKRLANPRVSPRIRSRVILRVRPRVRPGISPRGRPWGRSWVRPR